MIELIIGMGIAAVIAVLAVFVMRATIDTQGAVTSSTMAATRGQTIATRIDAVVRQAVGSAGAGDGVKVSSDGGLSNNRLDVRLASPASSTDSVCVTFAVEQASGNRNELYYRKVSGPSTATSLLTTGNAYTTSVWTPLLAWGKSVASLRVQLVTSTAAPYFKRVIAGTETGTGTGTGVGVTYSLRLSGSNTGTSGTDRNIDLAGTVRQRATAGAGASCF